MNAFTSALKDKTTETRTLNGSLTYSTSLSSNVDLFFLGSALRGQSESRITNLFAKAMAEDSRIAMANLWYIRDIRGGQGERQQARNIVKYLAKNYTDLITVEFINKLVNYGRYDDILVLLDTHKDLVIEYIRERLGNEDSLLAKWLPSENTSSVKTKQYAKMIRKGLGISSQEYRKILSQLRAKQHLVETALTNKDYDSIQYDHLPSKAGLKYRKAFLNNDAERYKAFLTAVNSGEKKINTGTLTPVDIVGKYFTHSWGSCSRPSDDVVLNTMWNNLPDVFNGEYENSIVVADTSGSMTSSYNGTSVKPISVCVALAMYIAERNKGLFKDTFMTFSDRPQLQEIKGKDLFEKINNLSSADWAGSTNLDAVFDKILRACCEHNVDADECPKRIYIISDMEFNNCVYSDTTTMNRIRQKYIECGYEIPQIFFWNVNSKTENVPVRFNEKGVGLISGFSPIILRYILNKEEVTPETIMMETLSRYLD